jgi:hypothetical protein
MKVTVVSAVVLASVSAFSGSALAQEGAPPPSKEPSIGYKVEAGVGSTKLTHGAPKYDTKSTPVTEDAVFARLKDLGPGTLQAGATFALALAPTTKKHEKSEELLPTVTYGGKLGPVQAEGGMRIYMYPRAEQQRQDIEGLARLSVPNRYVTPTLDVLPEFSEKRGVYAFVGAEHDFKLVSWLSIRPRLSFGEQGYALKSERLHAQDVTASAFVQAQLGGGLYAALRPSYSTLVGPDHYYKDPSVGGRSIAYLGFAVGAQR